MRGYFAIAKLARQLAELVAAGLLVAVFGAFLLQIVFRYVLGWPVGWTLEVSTLAWMWLVLWGSAFVVGERDEIRFDIIYSAVSDRLRRVFTVLVSAIVVALFLWSLPAVFDYVTFMKVEHASYIGVRLDYLFSVYLLFAVGALVRYLWLGFAALRGGHAEVTDPSLLREE